eukprot:gene13757-18450_t
MQWITVKDISKLDCALTNHKYRSYVWDSLYLLKGSVPVGGTLQTTLGITYTSDTNDYHLDPKQLIYKINNRDYFRCTKCYLKWLKINGIIVHQLSLSPCLFEKIKKSHKSHNIFSNLHSLKIEKSTVSYDSFVMIVNTVCKLFYNLLVLDIQASIDHRIELDSILMKLLSYNHMKNLIILKIHGNYIIHDIMIPGIIDKLHQLCELEMRCSIVNDSNYSNPDEINNLIIDNNSKSINKYFSGNHPLQKISLSSFSKKELFYFFQNNNNNNNNSNNNCSYNGNNNIKSPSSQYHISNNLKFSRLISLDVSFSPHINDGILLQLSYFTNNNLKELILNGCHNITDQGLVYLALSLNDIEATINGNNKNDLNNFYTSNNSISNTSPYHDNHHDAPQLLSSNAKLELSKSLANSSFEYKTQSKLSNLSHLNIGGCYRITDDGLIRMMDQLLNNKLLSKIELTWNYYEDKLLIISLRSCRLLTNRSICSIINYYRSLTSLDLMGCFQIHDDLLITIATTLINLTSLDISGCRNITDQGIIHYSEKVFKISNNGDRFDRKMIHFFVNGCVHLTDKGILAICFNLHDLLTLNIGWCVQVSDVGMEYLAKYLKLELLDIHGCSKITQNAWSLFDQNILKL